MEFYLRASQAGYLMTSGGTVMASSEQAADESLVVIENFDPVAKGPASDQTLRSQNLVTLRTSSGQILVPSNGQLVTGSAGSAPRMGYEVFRIFKVGGAKGETIDHGDPVALRFTPAGDQPVATWMGVQPGGAITFHAAELPAASDYWDLWRPIDLADFHLVYNDLINELMGTITLTGMALPGGSSVVLESLDASDLFETAELLMAEEQTASFSIELPAPFLALSPCSPRAMTVRATFGATGTCIDQTLKLEGDRAGFLTMKVTGAQKVKTGIMQGKAVQISAQLMVDPGDRRMTADMFPLVVAIDATDDRIIQSLEQDARELYHDEPVSFTFQIQPPPEGAPSVCTTLMVSYTLEGKRRESHFGAKINSKGIALDVSD